MKPGDTCDRCGEVWYGGSHWHCAQCDSPELTSYQGHLTKHAGIEHGEFITLDDWVMSCSPEYPELVRAKYRELGLADPIWKRFS